MTPAAPHCRVCGERIYDGDTRRLVCSTCKNFPEPIRSMRHERIRAYQAMIEAGVPLFEARRAD